MSACHYVHVWKPSKCLWPGTSDLLGVTTWGLSWCPDLFKALCSPSQDCMYHCREPPALFRGRLASVLGRVLVLLLLGDGATNFLMNKCVAFMLIEFTMLCVGDDVRAPNGGAAGCGSPNHFATAP